MYTYMSERGREGWGLDQRAPCTRRSILTPKSPCLSHLCHIDRLICAVTALREGDQRVPCTRRSIQTTTFDKLYSYSLMLYTTKSIIRMFSLLKSIIRIGHGPEGAMHEALDSDTHTVAVHAVPPIRAPTCVCVCVRVGVCVYVCVCACV